MGDASFLQTNFLGGEWSPYAQGRADKETYRTGLNICTNGLPVEEGAWVRRSGTLFAATTRSGLAGVLREFHFTQAQSYNMEFTDGHMRLFSGLSLVLELQAGVVAISSASPAVVVTSGAHGYTTADQVQFAVTPAITGTSPSGPAPLFNRQFAITVTDTTHFSIADPVTGAAIDGSTINLAGWNVTVARVVDFATNYTGGIWAANRVVQNETIALVLNAAVAPWALTAAATPGVLGFQTFTWAAATLVDGPYMDAPTDGTTITAGATTGTVMLTASSAASINGGTGFVATDVGRMIRLFSEPPAWAIGTAYAQGANVSYGGSYFQAVKANTGKEPDTDTGVNWIISTTAAAWTWAIIATISSNLIVTATLQAADPLGQQAGGNLLYTTAIKNWQLGLYSNTTGWPTGGTYHEGRFWLLGVTKNRIDGSMSNVPLRFSPTGLDGTVADDNGIAAVLEATDVNTIFWAIPGHSGLVLGTQAGEWSLQASAQADPLTPTSIQAHRVTRYGCANVEPRETGLSLVFVQRYQRKLYEFISDAYSGKFSGTNLAINSKHLTLPGIAEIAYVREPAPVIWQRLNDGSLKGMTYKRESPFGTQPASFFGYHKHVLGSGRLVESIQAGPAPGGNTDSLAMVTNDPATGIRYVEFLAPLFDEDGTLLKAQFSDAAVTPYAAEVSGSNVIFWGMNYIAGKTITAWVGGLDMGDFTVAANGSLTVPLNGAGSLLTTAYLQALTAQGGFGSLGVVFQVSKASGGKTSPFASGHPYIFAHPAALHYDNGFADFDRNVCYYDAAAPASGDPSTNGHTLHAFNMTTFTELWTAAPGEFAFAPSRGMTDLGADGNLYYATIDAAHLWGRFNTTTKVVDTDFADGTSSSPGYITTFFSGTVPFIFSCGLNAGQGSPGHSAQWVVVNMNPASQTVVARGFFDETRASLNPGNAYPFHGPAGHAFALVYNDTSTVIGLYKADQFGVGKIGTIIPTAVNGALTSFSTQPGQIVYDETDGNIIAAFTGNNSVIYLCKINSATAAIMWATVVNGVPDFWRSRVRYGVLTFLGATTGGGSYPVYQINTITGAIVSSTGQTLAGSNWTMADDKTGFMVFNINDIGDTQWTTFGPSAQAAVTPALTYTAPTMLGFTFTSDAQILRAIAPAESGSRNGPALAKSRRTQQIGCLMASTQGISFGTDFSHMRVAQLRSDGGTVLLTKLQLYTGIYWDTIDDTYSFDSMIAWRITRPYPANVLAVGPFLHTQDR